MGASEGDLTPLLSGRLVSDCGISPSPPPALSDLGIVINWEKSDLEPSNWAQCLGMLIDTIRERNFLTDSWIVRFRDLADHFLGSHLARILEQLIGHMASLESFISQSLARMLHLFSGSWRLCGPLLQMIQHCLIPLTRMHGVHLLVASGEVGIQSPSPVASSFSSCTPTLSRPAGVHISIWQRQGFGLGKSVPQLPEVLSTLWG